MKVITISVFCVFSICSGSDFFHENWHPKVFKTPETTIISEPLPLATDVLITVDTEDTITKVLPTIFGNNMNAWSRKAPDSNIIIFNHQNAVRHLNNLSVPTMRIPGGNWSNLWLWDNTIHWKLKENYTEDLKSRPTMQWTMTTAELLQFCDSAKSEPQICVNYSLARYIDEPDPVQKAAHYAAEWVRDINIIQKRKVRYWEVGNENYGKWQAGYQVNGVMLTAKEYGRDFCIFADSMKAADPSIKIGAVLYPGESGSNVLNWSRDVLTEVQDHADFLIIHEYFTWAQDLNTITAKEVLNARGTIANNIATVNRMVKQYTNKPSGHFPIALTEYNMRAGEKNTTHVCGLFIAEALGEIIKNGYSLANLWGIVNSKGFEDHGMFALDEPGADTYAPHPSFFPYYYYQKYFGDVMISAVSNDTAILAFASRFSSGHIGIVVINESAQSKNIEFDLKNFNPGLYAYRYEITADSLLSRKFTINNIGPSEGKIYGPEHYESIALHALNIQNGLVNYRAEKYSINYTVIEPKIKSETSIPNHTRHSPPTLIMNNRDITFSLQNTQTVTIKVFDLNGALIYTKSFGEIKKGSYTYTLHNSIQSGFYICQLNTGQTMQLTGLFIK